MLRRRVLAAAVAWVGVMPTALAHDFLASVVQVRATAVDGSIRLGSGVAVDGHRVATACHVTRDAIAIEVVHRGQRWKPGDHIGSTAHDLCMLMVPLANVPVARLRASESLRAGEAVVAAGFQNGGEDLVEKRGVVAALYPYDDGNVIRTSAAFDFGSSGGGLFDGAGNLVGLLAFRARTGQHAGFALPSEWIATPGKVASSFARIDTGVAAAAFWERPEANRPAFLGVAMRELAAGRP